VQVETYTDMSLLPSSRIVPF